LYSLNSYSVEAFVQVFAVKKLRKFEQGPIQLFFQQGKTGPTVLRGVLESRGYIQSQPSVEINVFTYLAKKFLNVLVNISRRDPDILRFLAVAANHGPQIPCDLKGASHSGGELK
jgi:hypothetical protein